VSKSRKGWVMKLNKIIILQNAIEEIAVQTDTTTDEIINNLIGFCWDEEDAGQLKDSLK
jgi:hypothetical protein